MANTDPKAENIEIDHRITNLEIRINTKDHMIGYYTAIYWHDL